MTKRPHEPEPKHHQRHHAPSPPKETVDDIHQSPQSLQPTGEVWPSAQELEKTDEMHPVGDIPPPAGEPPVDRPPPAPDEVPPGPPPPFSVASRAAPVDLAREDGEPLGDIPAPWIYTLIGLDGTISGAVMADAEAEWLDVGPYHLRVEMIAVPAHPRGVPVVFLPNSTIPEIADPRVTPPDMFSGQTGLAGTAQEAMMRNYHTSPEHDQERDQKAKGTVGRRVIFGDEAPKKPQGTANVA